MKIKAYLSHRRENDGLSNFAEKLCKWAPDGGIDLKVDCKDAELCRPINWFIDKLKTSSSVVFLLNEQFFKSPWCMGELYAFLSLRNASFHGFFIICDNWLKEQTDIQNYLSEFSVSLMAYWKTVVYEAKTPELVDVASQFIEATPEIFDILKRLNLPDEEKISECKGEVVWKRIKEQRERIKINNLPCSASDFEGECKQQIIEKLKYSSLLCNKLAVQLPDSKNEKNSIPSMVELLWQKEMSDRLSTFYRCADDALRDCELSHRSNIKEGIRDILVLLLLGFVDKENRKKVLYPTYGLLDIPFMDLLETEEEVAELCIASAEPTFKPKFIYNKELCCLEVSKERYHSGNKVEGSLHFSCDSVFDAELRLIWNETFPNKNKKVNEYLSGTEMKRLKKGLQRNFERGHTRYYLVPIYDTQHPMNRPGVIEALKNKLPFLFVVRTGVIGRPALIAADFESTDITDELESFAKLFK